MADYFTSDVHLRFEEPSRSARFARFVSRLEPSDSLTIAGDLSDFWLASRQRRLDPRHCPGHRSLLDFLDRGGTLTILLGNHDHWLGPTYNRWFGPVVVPEPLLRTSHGHRLHIVHGHLLGARKPWKAAMEGRAFLQAFGALPEPLARSAEACLRLVNERNLARTHRRHLHVYRQHASQIADSADLFLFGHVHETFDEPLARSRLIVLGDWFHGQSYLKIDSHGARFLVEPLPTPSDHPDLVIA